MFTELSKFLTMEILHIKIWKQAVLDIQSFLYFLQGFVSDSIDLSIPSLPCYIRPSNVLGLHAISDLLIALAFFIISAGFYYIMKKRKDLQQVKPFFVLFMIFMILCGINRLVDVYTIWYPVYDFSKVLKSVNAIVSVITLLAVWPLLPRILRLPSPDDLQSANRKLQQQIHERLKVEKELQLHKDTLASMVDVRTKDLEFATQKLTHEIRDRKEAQEKVQFQASLLAQVKSAVVATNLDYEIVYWNRSAESLYGWKAEEVLGKRTVDVLVAKDQTRQANKILRMLRNKKKWEGEINLLHKEGYRIPIHMVDTALVDQHGADIGYAFVSFDISDHVASEKKLQRAKEKAEKAVVAKQDFLSTMSHEIRTPLNVIIGMARLLMESQPKPEQTDYLKSLQFSANHLLVIINDILDFSKIEAGKIKLEEISFDIQEVVNGIAKAFSFKAEEKNIAFSTYIDPAVPPRVIGDEVRLTQILNNLVGNAIKFTETGFVSIHVKVKKQVEDKIDILFEIRDSGIGIDGSKVNTVFDSFTQAKADTTRRFGGSGLGLTICKKLVELQGGNIWLRSKEGVGSTFSFELAYTQDHEMAARPPQRIEHLDKSHLRGFRLLLVEDNISNQMVASNFLAKVGIHVDFADHGQIALDMVQQKEYDIILMDLQMPVMDGFAATQEIRKLGGAFKKLPIIALTADVVSDVKERVYRCGMNDYLPKPFNPDELYLKIAINLNLPINSEAFHLQNEETLSLLRIVEQYSDDTQFVTSLLDSLKSNFVSLPEQVAEIAGQKDLYNLRKVTHKQLPSIKMVENHALQSQLEKLKQMLAQEYMEDKKINSLLDEIKLSSEESVRYIEELSSKMDKVPDTC